MAAFKQDFTIVQSDDCSTLTIADNSNFGVGNNDENYTFSSFTTKTIAIYDSASNLLQTLTIVDTTPVTYTLTKDMYLSLVYTLQHNTDTPLVKTYNVAFSCFVELAYGTIVAKDYNNGNCLCDSTTDDADRLFNINKGIKAAQIFASTGNSTLSQDMLNLANSYTNIFN